MLIIKGIIIGIGKIIPGVSGAMLAISMGLYERIIDSINNFFFDIKENSKFLSKLSIGLLIAIIFFSKIMFFLLNKYYMITIFLFIGFILGSLDDIKIEITKKNNYITIIIFILMMVLGLFNVSNNIMLNNDLKSTFILFISGILDGFAMVMPGVSGTAILMMIGTYDKIIYCMSELFYLKNMITLIPFVIGIIIGVFITIKIVSFLFKHYKSKTYSAILGFCLATVVLMGIKCFNTSYTLITLIISFISLIIGTFIVNKINHIISYD